MSLPDPEAVTLAARIAAERARKCTRCRGLKILYECARCGGSKGCPSCPTCGGSGVSTCVDCGGTGRNDTRVVEAQTKRRTERARGGKRKRAVAARARERAAEKLVCGRCGHVGSGLEMWKGGNIVTTTGKGWRVWCKDSAGCRERRKRRKRTSG